MSFIKLIVQDFADKLDISSWPLSLVSFQNDFRSDAVKTEFINAWEMILPYLVAGCNDSQIIVASDFINLFLLSCSMFLLWCATFLV